MVDAPEKPLVTQIAELESTDAALIARDDVFATADTDHETRLGALETRVAALENVDASPIVAEVIAAVARLNHRIFGE